MLRVKRPLLDTHGELACTLANSRISVRRVVFVALSLVITACGSDHSPFQIGETGDAATGTGGKPASGGATGAGGASSSDAGSAGGDPSVCHASNLSSAPLQCLQDFTHIKAKYGTRCTTDGGYQAHCDPYDALVYHSATTNVWCYYDSGTGNLIGARETTDATGAAGTCVTFDTSFAEPPVTSCMSAEGETCSR
ncbi:MAG TPA: hypothetical protein VH062_27245 [Polyangiaceae bacterium]|jgi:hypothetical protein|nr:hypothetical protein [Polyangiaceae bacterium]